MKKLKIKYKHILAADRFVTTTVPGLLSSSNTVTLKQKVTSGVNLKCIFVLLLSDLESKKILILYK